MNFSWNDDELALRVAVEEFCRKQFQRDDIVERDHAAEFSRAAWEACGTEGLFGLVLDGELGGTGLAPSTSVLLMEAFGRGCPDLGLAFSIAAHVYACVLPLRKFGTPEQKKRYLPDLVVGRRIAAHSITEPNAGSDVFNMSTTAEHKGNKYILRGTKCLSTNAPVADVFLVHAVTKKKYGFFGISSFLVDVGTPGLTVGKPHSKIGLRTSPIGDIYLDECEVDATSLLGAEGSGGAIFTYSMTWERTCIFAIYVGAMQRQLDDCVRFAKERKQFGQPISKFQDVSYRVVDMKVRLEAARMLLYRAAWNLDQGKDEPMDAAIAKLFISEAAVATGLDTIQIHGGSGVVSDSSERFLRDAIPSRIFSGASEIMRNNIARWMGL